MNVSYPEAPDIQRLIDGAQRIVIVQADNPDGDSLGSALALKLLRYERPSSRQRISERLHEVALHRLTKLRIDLVCDRHHSG